MTCWLIWPEGKRSQAVFGRKHISFYLTYIYIALKHPLRRTYTVKWYDEN